MRIHRYGLLLVLTVGTLIVGAPRAVEPRTPARDAGRVDAWIFHFDDLMPDAALATQVGVMQAAAPEARLLVAVTGMEAERLAAEMLEQAGAPMDRVEFQRVAGPLSPWARDRYVVVEGEATSVVIVPPVDVLATTWRGDAQVGRALAGLGLGTAPVAVHFHVEGGDLLIGTSVALVGAGTVARESRRLRLSPPQVQTLLERTLRRRVIVVGSSAADLPHDHLDMFLTLVDDRTVVLGDPLLTRGYFQAATDLGIHDPHVGDFGQLVWRVQEAAAPMYAALAKELTEAGFTVHRIPIVHTPGTTILTWNNVVLDRQETGTIAHVPSYGIPHLDRAAARTWRELGFVARMIPSAEIILHGGAVRCITNDVRARRP